VAFAGIVEPVKNVVVDMTASGETPPIPYADRHYAGEFMTRVPGDLHRRWLSRQPRPISA
jgi:hypothetical protein